MTESDIEKVDCAIEEFLYKIAISKSVEIREITKLGQYKLPWEDTMYIYLGIAGEERVGTIFLSHGDIKDKSIQFATKEKGLDNKKTITITVMVLDGIEYEIYKFDSNYKPWVYKVKD